MPWGASFMNSTRVFFILFDLGPGRPQSSDWGEFEHSFHPCAL